MAWHDQQHLLQRQAWLQLLATVHGAPDELVWEGEEAPPWQPSSLLQQPSLAGWAQQGLQDLGLSPELLEVWAGLAGCGLGAWARAEDLARRGYLAHQQAAQRVLDAGRCEQLRGWYEAQQFRTPVVLAAG
jgi:hypothetical protein